MAKNITLMGASYSDVPAVTLPQTGGGTATFLDPVGSQTVTSNGTYDVSTLAEMVVNVSGGGGASNVVTGTFKGTTTGSTLQVNIPYTGNGYPIALTIVPVGGIYGNTTFSEAIARYAIGYVSAYKSYQSVAPTYQDSGTENQYSVTAIYKSSTSATAYSGTGAANTLLAYGSSAVPSGTVQSALFYSKNVLAVRIYSADSSSQRGFLAGVEYAYQIIYSS